MKRKKVELLSPAGNVLGFYGAINAGADAIYLGGEKFGARAYADNFTTEQLVECIELAHIRKVKVYLTVNTLLKEEEMEELYFFLEPLYLAGLDGVIIQDLGVARLIGKYFPDLECHASTQMTLTNRYSLEYLKENGFTRVVPSRELTLEEIKELEKHSDIELECFIHGAMCYCYSGQCLYSSVLGGRSGNRGRCAQPCRLPYKVIDDKHKASELFYPLSMKDQETAGILDQLIEAGIDSFKIEGRMKKPEYSAGVTAVYRRIIDRFYKSGQLEIQLQDLELLAKLYRRSDKQEGYYHTLNGECMITKEKPSYNSVDEGLLEKIREDYLHYPEKLKITGFVYLSVDEEICLTLQYKDIAVTVTGEVVAAAKNRALTKQDVMKQLSKMGETPFSLEELQVDIEENAFCSVRGLNELRRAAVSELKSEIIRKNGFPVREAYKKTGECLSHEKDRKERPELQNGFSVSVSTKEQLNAVKKSDFRIQYLYLDYALFLSLEQDELSPVQEITKLYVSLPHVFRNRNLALFKRIYEKYKHLRQLIAGFEVHNLEELQWLKKSDFEGELISSENLYCFNSYAAACLKEDVGRLVLPWEQTKKEALCMLENNKDTVFEKILYGRTQMMVTANCLAKTMNDCKKDGKQHIYFLSDRMKAKFPVRIDCEICCNCIYNSVPFCSFDSIDLYRKYGIIRLAFTIEDEMQTLEVLRYFKENNQEKPDFAYTTCFDKRVTE